MKHTLQDFKTLAARLVRLTEGNTIARAETYATRQRRIYDARALLIPALLISFAVILAAVLPVVAAPTGPIINGSFETGDYTGWTLLEDSGYPESGTWGIASNGETIFPGDVTWDFYDGVLVAQWFDGLPITYFATDGTISPTSYKTDQRITGCIRTLHCLLAS